MESTLPDPPVRPWLIRISETFDEFSQEIVHALGGVITKKLGHEYYLIQVSDLGAMRRSAGAKYLRWNLPVDHAWPCNPEKMVGFVEKAAQAMARKFKSQGPQAIFIGQLDPSVTHRYYKTLASNLRGRTLQLFPSESAGFSEVEAQAGSVPTLFGLIGKEGLFCGLQSPRESNGFYPGGTKYIAQNQPDTVSRAGAKIAEALHHLLLHRKPLKKGSHWLELGASPGGMTSELLARDYKVTALDRAPLDPRLAQHPNLTFALLGVGAFKPSAVMRYDAILSDMNGEPLEAVRQVARLSANLKPGGLVIFTLKTAGISAFDEINHLHETALALFIEAGLRWITTTHLTYNRAEFTLFLEFDGSGKSTA